MRRIIPKIVMHDQSIYRTKYFQKDIYLGDPINIVQVLSLMKAHEICLVNISDDSAPMDLLAEIFSSSFVPLSFGGSISSVDQAKKIISMGCEKIILGSHSYLNPSFSIELALEIGAQSVILAIDVRKENGNYNVYANQGSNKLPFSLEEILTSAKKNGIGEIHLTNIDLTGTFLGIDYELAFFARKLTNLPLVIGGGLNKENLSDENLDNRIDLSGSSIFCIRPPLDAPLLNYDSND